MQNENGRLPTKKSAAVVSTVLVVQYCTVVLLVLVLVQYRVLYITVCRSVLVGQNS